VLPVVYYSDTWRWDGADWTAVTVADPPPPRRGHALGPLGKRLLMFGGQDGTGILGDYWFWIGNLWDPRPSYALSWPSPRTAASLAAR
jgi:hypothetical protein